MQSKLLFVFAIAAVSVVSGNLVKRQKKPAAGAPAAGGVQHKDEIDIFIEQLDKAERLEQLTTCRSEIDSIFGGKTWKKEDFHFDGDRLVNTTLAFACFDQCLFREYGLSGDAKNGLPDPKKYEEKVAEAATPVEKEGFQNALSALNRCLEDLDENRLPHIDVDTAGGVGAGEGSEKYEPRTCINAMKVDFCLHKNLQQGATDKAVVALSMQILDRLALRKAAEATEKDD